MSIKTDAQVIRDETVLGANTAIRVGTNLVAIADDLLAKQTAIDLNTDKVSYTDAAQVSTNTTDITTLQGEQTTQDAAIALNTAKRSYPSADETKLAGISAGAEVNPDVVPQLEAESGIATTERIWTAQRVKQAIDALGGGGGASVDDTAYAVSWDGVTSVAPSKNAIYDLIENQVFKVDTTSNIIPIFWGGTQAEYDIDFPAGHPSNYFVIITDGAVTPLDAADITNTPSGNLVATNVQAALNELQSEIDGFAGGSYNDEQAQDAIGTILVDSSEIDFVYNDLTPSITASIVAGSIDETKLDLSVNASLDLADTAVQPAAIANFETTTELNARDTANRDRANHTGTQLAATISDFQTTVSANTDVSANTTKLAGIEAGATADQTASEVPIVDTGTLITATDVEGALSENRTAINLNTAKVSFDSTASTKVGFISVTQAVDLDTMESDIATNKQEVIQVACSDLTTDLTTGTSKAYFRMPYAATLNSVRASVLTAPTGSNIIVDINENGTSLMTTTKLSIDATEKTSTTATTAAVLTDTALADDSEITIDIDQVGSTVAGAGLIVTLKLTRT